MNLAQTVGFISGAILVASASLLADTIHLRTGKSIEGRVLGYSNMAFEVKTNDGPVQRLPQAQVARIVFDERPVLLDTRVQGKVEGLLRAYDNAAFQVQPPKGAPLNIPATVVHEMSFGPGGPGSESGAEASGASSRKIEKINRNGQRVDISRHLVTGKVTIVAFSADWCGPCRALAPVLEDLAKTDPEVYLRKVDIDRWESPVAKQYNINSIPRVEVYDRRGRQVPLAGPDRETAIRNAIVKAKDS